MTVLVFLTACSGSRPEANAGPTENSPSQLDDGEPRPNTEGDQTNDGATTTLRTTSETQASGSPSDGSVEITECDIAPSISAETPSDLYAVGNLDDEQLCMGPTSVAGPVIESTSWFFVNETLPAIGVTFTEDGLEPLNDLASECFQKTLVCPTGRAAIVIDGTVIIAAEVQAPSFNGDITISGFEGMDPFEVEELSDRLGDFTAFLQIRPVLTTSAA